MLNKKCLSPDTSVLVMQLHILCGRSPFLWMKAVLSNEWSKVKIYTHREIIEQTIRICGELLKLSNCEMEVVAVQGLESANSMEEYSIEFEKDLDRFKPVEEDVILFYSGTVPHLAILVSRLNYRSLMKFHSGKFIVNGHIEKTIDEYELDLDQFFKLHGYSQVLERGNTSLILRDAADEIIFKSNEIMNIELSYFGKILIDWKKPESSGQRKKSVARILHLIELFGRHSMEHNIEDPIIENWLKNVNMPFEMESEEE